MQLEGVLVVPPVEFAPPAALTAPVAMPPVPSADQAPPVATAPPRDEVPPSVTSSPVRLQVVDRTNKIKTHEGRFRMALSKYIHFRETELEFAVAAVPNKSYVRLVSRLHRATTVQ